MRNLFEKSAMSYRPHIMRSMHYLHLIVVPKAATSVPEVLTQYIQQQGPEAWWDWFSIGGRWDGHLAELLPNRELDNPNMAVLDAELRSILIADINRHQDRVFLEARDKLTGSVVAESDISGHVFGLPVAPNAQQAAAMSAENASSAQDWAAILSSPTAAAARDLSRRPLVTYYTRQLLDLLDNSWTSESGFYDYVNFTTDPRQLLRMTPEQMADTVVVAVDFHA